MNLSGAEKLASYFGKCLSEDCSLRNRRGEEELERIWEEKQRRYEEEIQRQSMGL